MKSRFLHFFLSLSGSPPARGVWIEIRILMPPQKTTKRSPPARVVWIEIRILMPHQKNTKRSPPARVVWIEICMRVLKTQGKARVATREGGVD